MGFTEIFDVSHGVNPWNECASIMRHQVCNFAQLEPQKSSTFTINPKRRARVPNFGKTRIKRGFTLRIEGDEP